MASGSCVDATNILLLTDSYKVCLWLLNAGFKDYRA